MIYFDNAATTKPLKDALEKAQVFNEEKKINAASTSAGEQKYLLTEIFLTFIYYVQKDRYTDFFPLKYLHYS